MKMKSQSEVRARVVLKFKVRLPQEYFDSIATAMEMVGCGSRAAQGARNLDQQWDKLTKIREHWERMITRDSEL